MINFSCKNKIRFRGEKTDSFVYFPSLVDCLLEASLLHTEATSRKMEWYSANKKAFLLTNWQVRVFSSPKWNEEFTINTWPIFVKGIVCGRVFEAVDANGGVIAYANSAWVYTDLERRRPIKLDEKHFAEYGGCRPSKMEEDYKIPGTDGYTLVNESRFVTARRDLDKNDHVNNISYIEWATDCIPDDVYDGCQITEMKCAYKSQCGRGVKILAETFQDNANKCNIIVRLYKVLEENILLCELFFGLA